MSDDRIGFIERLRKAEINPSDVTKRMCVRAGLARIRSKSTIYADGWQIPEAGLLWAIYEQAVMDHFFGKCANPRVTDADLRTARFTMETGAIFMPSGSKQNVLEILRIDPEWALRQLNIVVDRVEDIAA